MEYKVYFGEFQSAPLGLMAFICLVYIECTPISSCHFFAWDLGKCQHMEYLLFISLKLLKSFPSCQNLIRVKSLSDNFLSFSFFQLIFLPLQFGISGLQSSQVFLYKVKTMCSFSDGDHVHALHLSLGYRGYYTVARRYGFYLQVARRTSHKWDCLTSETLETLRYGVNYPYPHS